MSATLRPENEDRQATEEKIHALAVPYFHLYKPVIKYLGENAAQRSGLFSQSELEDFKWVDQNPKVQFALQEYLRQRDELRCAYASGDSTRAHRRANERAGLRAMDSFELVQCERATLALEVEQLSADHAAGAGRPHQLRDELSADHSRQTERATRVERDGRSEWDHRNAGGHGHRRAERAMDGRPTASHVVIVHAR